jgi:hypothetical protein
LLRVAVLTHCTNMLDFYFFGFLLQLDPLFEGYDLSRVRTELGPHQRDSLLNASQLVLSPGIPLTQPDVAAAIQHVSTTTAHCVCCNQFFSFL